jgi:hypothetical protein
MMASNMHGYGMNMDVVRKQRNRHPGMSAGYKYIDQMQQRRWQ